MALPILALNSWLSHNALIMSDSANCQCSPYCCKNISLVERNKTNIIHLDHGCCRRLMWMFYGKPASWVNIKRHVLLWLPQPRKQFRIVFCVIYLLLLPCKSVHHLSVQQLSQYITVFMWITLFLLPRGWLIMQPSYNEYSCMHSDHWP